MRDTLDMHADPVSEGQPVAEACVDRVLEMGVRVDEARDDGRVREARLPVLDPRLGGGPDGLVDLAVLEKKNYKNYKARLRPQRNWVCR